MKNSFKRLILVGIIIFLLVLFLADIAANNHKNVACGEETTIVEKKGLKKETQDIGCRVY